MDFMLNNFSRHLNPYTPSLYPSPLSGFSLSSHYRHKVTSENELSDSNIFDIATQKSSQSFLFGLLDANDVSNKIICSTLMPTLCLTYFKNQFFGPTPLFFFTKARLLFETILKVLVVDLNFLLQGFSFNESGNN